ncbi:MAG: hypothetical protein UR15_C0013G0005 [Parcubacteria group bacterium GW2011_GWA2_31_28]|nr:MAG: hypothetical protein UR15_C0013G0005 [Parcubacteria group bacterium GW2011_GWA2_31_28]
MNKFSDIKFEFKSKNSLNKYRDIIEDFINQKREELNSILDKLELRKESRLILEKSNYQIKILVDTIKPSMPNKGTLFGALGLSTKNNSAIIFILAKDINTFFNQDGIKKDLTYYEILQTLIHELSHLFIRNEQKNKVFTKEIAKRIGLIQYINNTFFDLLYLRQVGINRLKSMNKIGIKSLDDINEDNRQKLKNLPGSSDWHVNQWIEQAKIIKEGKILFRKLPIVDKLLKENYIIFNIEMDYRQSQIFFISTYNSSTKEINQFFEKKKEKRLLEDLIRYLEKYPDHILLSYSNNNYDEYQLMKRIEDLELKNISNIFIDICLYIQEIILGRFSSSDYNLKALSNFFGYKFSTHLSGTDVGYLLDDYLNCGKECDWKKIKQYNKEDVLAVKYILDEILKNCGSESVYIKPKIKIVKVKNHLKNESRNSFQE